MGQGARTPLAELAERGGDELRERWHRRFAASPLRLGGPRSDDLAALGEPLAARVLEVLSGESSRTSPSPAGRARDLVPGAGAVREIERAAAFLGAQAASTRAENYDVAALLIALRDALGDSASEGERGALGTFFEWLVIVAMEAYGNAARAQAVEQAHSELERGMPVVMLPGGVPAAFLVANPPASVLEAVLGRLLLLVARVGARAVVVDGSGLADPGGREVIEAIGGLFAHRELRARAALFAGGVSGEAAGRWRQAARALGTELELFEASEDAVASAMAAAGHRQGPRRA